MIVVTNKVAKTIGVAVQPVRTLSGPLDWIDDITDLAELVTPDINKLREFVIETLSKGVAAARGGPVKWFATLSVLGKKGLEHIGRLVFDPNDSESIGRFIDTYVLEPGVSPWGVRIIDTQEERDWVEKTYGLAYLPGEIGVIFFGAHQYMDP